MPSKMLSPRSIQEICLFFAPMARKIESCRRRSLTFIRNVLRMMKAAIRIEKAVVSVRPCSVEVSVSCMSCVLAVGRCT